MKPITKRMTSRLEGSEHDGGFVVFLIGMRVNRWWKPWKWLPVGLAMPRMIRELTKDPELGFLGGEPFFGRTTLLLSYWKSTDHLMRFATSQKSSHFPAWRAFYQAVGASGDVGIWHETYSIAPGRYENIYMSMPPFGLGRVGALEEAVGPHARAARRMAGAAAPVHPAPANAPAG